eukprot:1137619-Pelagomonas_calceolata.AAC.7
MEMPPFWKELARVTDLGSLEAGGVTVPGTECSLFPPRPPLLLNRYRELVVGTIFIGTDTIASGRLEVSHYLSGTGTLYNQKHVVRFKRSPKVLCPLPGCHQLDNALHMLSGCQNHIISSMKTERHNAAVRMTSKAFSKIPWEQA